MEATISSHTTRARGASTMKMTKIDCLTSLFTNNEAYCNATTHARELARVAYEGAQAPLLRIRLENNWHQIRRTDAELAAAMTAGQKIREVSLDPFARSNLDPVLNQVGKAAPPLSGIQVELEATQRLYALFNI
jgi:hypothetical protein